MRKHRQLTFRDRIYIEVWHWESRSLSYMAKRLGVHASTISRELRRGDTGKPSTTLRIGYRADIGEQRRRLWAVKKGRPSKIVGSMAQLMADSSYHRNAEASLPHFSIHLKA